MIQEIIKRMAGNLFYLKGWSITLIAGAFALAAKDSNSLYVLLPYFPLLMFWGLDAYFLSQERLFRQLYDYVRKKPDGSIDFSMDTSPFQSKWKSISLDWGATMIAPTLLAFYAPLFFIVLYFTYKIIPH